MKSGWIGKITNSPEETVMLGHEFSKFLEKGDVYAFIGQLASGKTTFIKGILKGLNYKKTVTSPTFTLVNEYESDFSIIHIDCYREDELERWIKLGMNDYLSDENIVLIEWANKINTLLPSNTIYLNFSHQDINKRKISIK